MLYTDPTQDLYNFEARATPLADRKHEYSRRVDLERLELLARIAFQLCALNVLGNLFYTQPKSKSIRFGSRCKRVHMHALRITPHTSFPTVPFSFNLNQILGLYGRKS